MSYDLFLHHSFSVQFCSQISPCYAFEPLSEAHNTINIHASNVDTWQTHERWMTWKYSLVIVDCGIKKIIPRMRDKKKHVIPWDTRDKFIPLRPYSLCRTLSVSWIHLPELSDFLSSFLNQLVRESPNPSSFLCSSHSVPFHWSFHHRCRLFCFPVTVSQCSLRNTSSQFRFLSPLFPFACARSSSQIRPMPRVFTIYLRLTCTKTRTIFPLTFISFIVLFSPFLRFFERPSFPLWFFSFPSSFWSFLLLFPIPSILLFLSFIPSLRLRGVETQQFTTQLSRQDLDGNLGQPSNSTTVGNFECDFSLKKTAI